MKLTNITQTQSRDTGLIIVLGLLIFLYFRIPNPIMLFAIGLILVSMLVPILFKPIAFLWFGFANLLSKVTSSLLLSLLYLVLVTPVGLIRHLIGKDSMKTALWKASSESVFSTYDHTYTENDLRHPY